MKYLEYIDISAIIQIAILYFVIYSILKAAKGSRFGQALMGVGILAATMIAFTYVFRFDVLSRIIQALLAYLAISTVVIFQPEIRRVLSAVGAFGYFDRPKFNADGLPTAEFVVETIKSLAERRLGALIAFEHGISLKSYEDSGVATDARFSNELLTSIFTPPLPLHDGGVTIRNGRIAAAHCVFPVSNNPELITRGMRHRAAVGLSEETDALVVVVSEETGSISIAHNGRMTRYDSDKAAQALSRWIGQLLPNGRPQNRLMARLEELLTKGGKRK